MMLPLLLSHSFIDLVVSLPIHIAVFDPILGLIPNLVIQVMIIKMIIMSVIIEAFQVLVVGMQEWPGFQMKNRLYLALHPLVWVLDLMLLVRT